MLVLSRNNREIVQIEHAGEMVEILIQQVRGNKVRLGFIGPKTFNIRRKELVDDGMKSVENCDESEAKTKVAVAPQTFTGPPQPLTTDRIRNLKQRKLDDSVGH